MIFPALYRFATNHGLLEDLDFVGQTIHCVFLLHLDGTLSSIVRGDVKGIGVSRIPPRTASAIACLGADTLNRVIPNFDPEANDFARQTQKLFVSQLEAAYESNPHQGVASVIRFLRSLHESDPKRKEVAGRLLQMKFKPSEWVSFQVESMEGGQLLPKWQTLQVWWRAEQAKRRQQSIDTESMRPCIVTGRLCNPVRTHGTRIKVAPGGLPGGVALVSNDKAAFGSYGFEKSLVSPMSEEAVEGYVRAVNWLGESGNQNYHYRTTDTNFLFFSDQPVSERNPGKAIELGDWQELLDETPEPDSSGVPVAARKIMVAPHTGHLSPAHASESQRFYCLSLSGSSARGIIRGWIDQPLQVARENVDQWLEDISIQLDRPLLDSKKRQIAGSGEFYHRWPLWRLVACLQGEGETAKKQIAQWREQLWEGALLGRSSSIPIALVILAVSKIQAKGDVTPVRAALIRCILNRLQNRKEYMKAEFDLNLQSPAFHCGRLLRLLKNIQWAALGDTNSTVVSKYYAAASARPATVFGLLLSNVQNHLTKIRGEKPGLAQYFDTNLTEIVGDKIVGRGGFPKVNQPDAQGEFALGFYFQGIRTKKEKPEAEVEPQPEETQETFEEN